MFIRYLLTYVHTFQTPLRKDVLFVFFVTDFKKVFVRSCVCILYSHDYVNSKSTTLFNLFDNCPEKKGKESTFQETGTDPTYVQVISTVILRTYK